MTTISSNVSLTRARELIVEYLISQAKSEPCCTDVSNLDDLSSEDLEPFLTLTFGDGAACCGATSKYGYFIPAATADECDFDEENPNDYDKEPNDDSDDECDEQHIRLLKIFNGIDEIHPHYKINYNNSETVKRLQKEIHSLDCVLEIRNQIEMCDSKFIMNIWHADEYTEHYTIVDEENGIVRAR